jgi:hypothetical protein
MIPDGCYTVTPTTQPVCWDHDGEPEIVLNARVILGEDGLPLTYNGFLRPVLERPEIDRYIAWAATTDQMADTLRWDGETLVHTSTDDDEYEYRAEAICYDDGTDDDDVLGLWEVGPGWTWMEAPR